MSALLTTIVSNLFIAYLFYTKPIASTACTSRCGATWSDANTQCGSCCTDDSSCGADTCYGDLDPTPCLTPSPTICTSRCGTDWANSNTNCGTCCIIADDCTTGTCYADVDPSPCIITPIPTDVPTTAIPTIAIPTHAPIIGNKIGNYRIATISGCGSGKYVSLTFDDGPKEQNEATAKIINTLNTYGIKATFYVSPAADGDNALGLAKKCILIKNLTESGHDVQSHSWSHPDFANTNMTQSQIKTQLDTVRDFIVNCDGIAPTIFRPPYGSLTEQQAEYIVQNLRYIIGFWNLDSNDWRTPNNFSGISPNFNLNLYNGDSMNVLMHDASSYNVLDDIINLFDNGYEFITQTECFERCDTIDHDGICNDIHGQASSLTIIDAWRSTLAPTSITNNPTLTPTNIPSLATQSPSKYPTLNPSKYPTIEPTKYPSIYPSKFPSLTPTEMPTNPTQNPSQIPTQNPTEFVTEENFMSLMTTKQGILYVFLGVIAIALMICFCIGMCCFCKQRKRERELEKNMNDCISLPDSISHTVNINPMQMNSTHKTFL